MSDSPEHNDAPQPVTPPATETQVTEEQPAPAQPQERTFSQAEVDDILKDRLARERRKHKPKAQTSTPQPPPQTESPEIAEKVALLERRLAEQQFEAVALKKGITSDAALSVLKSAFMAEAPEDPGKWIDDRKSAFVAPAPPPESEPQPEPGTQSQAQPQPTLATGGAPTQVQKDFSGEVDVMKLTRDDISRLQRTGKFHTVLQRYRDSLPGGGNGVFKKRLPK